MADLTPEQMRHPLARAYRLYRDLSTGDAVLHRRGDHREVDVDRAMCSDTATGLLQIVKGETWTCFQCGEVFTDRRAAADHFGLDPAYEPGCAQMLTETEKAIVEDRRFWREQALKDQERCELLEYSASSEAAMLLSLFGTMDLREVERKYRLMKELMDSTHSLMAHMIRYDKKVAAEAFFSYDPQLVSPDEYLVNLEKR